MTSSGTRRISEVAISRIRRSSPLPATLGMGSGSRNDALDGVVVRWHGVVLPVELGTIPVEKPSCQAPRLFSRHFLRFLFNGLQVTVPVLPKRQHGQDAGTAGSSLFRFQFTDGVVT